MLQRALLSMCPTETPALHGCSRCTPPKEQCAFLRTTVWSPHSLDSESCHSQALHHWAMAEVCACTPSRLSEPTESDSQSYTPTAQTADRATMLGLPFTACSSSKSGDRGQRCLMGEVSLSQSLAAALLAEERSTVFSLAGRQGCDIMQRCLFSLITVSCQS